MLALGEAEFGAIPTNNPNNSPVSGDYYIDPRRDHSEQQHRSAQNSRNNPHTPAHAQDFELGFGLVGSSLLKHASPKSHSKLSRDNIHYSQSQSHTHASISSPSTVQSQFQTHYRNGANNSPSPGPAHTQSQSQARAESHSHVQIPTNVNVMGRYNSNNGQSNHTQSNIEQPEVQPATEQWFLKPPIGEITDNHTVNAHSNGPISNNTNNNLKDYYGHYSEVSPPQQPQQEQRNFAYSTLNNHPPNNNLKRNVRESLPLAYDSQLPYDDVHVDIDADQQRQQRQQQQQQQQRQQQQQQQQQQQPQQQQQQHDRSPNPHSHSRANRDINPHTISASSSSVRLKEGTPMNLTSPNPNSVRTTTGRSVWGLDNDLGNGLGNGLGNTEQYRLHINTSHADNKQLHTESPNFTTNNNNNNRNHGMGFNLAETAKNALLIINRSELNNEEKIRARRYLGGMYVCV